MDVHEDDGGIKRGDQTKYLRFPSGAITLSGSLIQAEGRVNDPETLPPHTHTHPCLHSLLMILSSVNHTH